MKKSILNFGGVMMLFFLIFACTKEQENVRLSDDKVSFKGKVDNEKDEADGTDSYSVGNLLSYLHGYIKYNVADDFKYYENIPERKKVKWFYENFERHLKSGTDADQWVLDKIDSGEIFIFGTYVKDIKVAALIFSDDLVLPKEFEHKSGIFFDTNTPEDCMVWSNIGHERGKSTQQCYCHMIYACHYSWCWTCEEDMKGIDFEDLLDLDKWIINDYDIDPQLPVININIGDPVLPVKHK